MSDLGVACPGAVRWLQLDSWLVPASLPVILQQAGSGLFTVGPEHRAPREQAEAARPSSPLRAVTCSAFFGSEQVVGLVQILLMGLLQSDISEGTGAGKTVISVTYHT